MMTPSQRRDPWRSRRLAAILALLLTTATLIWAPDALALRAKRSGAGGCGNFIDAVQNVENGDILIPMHDTDGGRNASGTIIGKNLLIEGGWSPPLAGCPPDNVLLDTPQALLGAGFGYGGVGDRAQLNLITDPIVIDGAVKDLRFLAVNFQVQGTFNTNGGGISATDMISASLTFEQVGFEEDPNNPGLELQGNGGGLYLDITGGSRVTLRQVDFSNLAAQNGGGFEIHVRGGSQLVIDQATFSGNQAVGFGSGRGGGGRIILESGSISITNSLFSNNSAASAGGALSIERPGGASGPAEVWLINNQFSGNSAPNDPDVAVSGDGLTVHTLEPAGYVSLVSALSVPSATITSITRNGDVYSVNFSANGFTPQLPGQHVHFFFDTVPPEQAGMPGSGPWFVYGGGSPFTGYGVANRPFGASKLCVLVANPNHSVIQNTGNCVALP